LGQKKVVPVVHFSSEAKQDSSRAVTIGNDENNVTVYYNEMMSLSERRTCNHERANAEGIKSHHSQPLVL
jgi:hypothetical protein